VIPPLKNKLVRVCVRKSREQSAPAQADLAQQPRKVMIIARDSLHTQACRRGKKKSKRVDRGRVLKNVKNQPS